VKLKAQFHRKQSEFATSLAEVEKVIELPRDEFRAFLRSPLDDYPFITENKDRMKMDQDGVYHCLLVVGESHDDGILIEAEGYDYARYSAYVPGARYFVEACQEKQSIKFFLPSSRLLKSNLIPSPKLCIGKNIFSSLSPGV